MPQRIAAITSIIVFVGCLFTGAFGAENSFVTAVERALMAMLATLFIGLIVGWMAQKMINENVGQVVKAAAAPVADGVATAKAAPSKSATARPAASKSATTKPAAAKK